MCVLLFLLFPVCRLLRERDVLRHSCRLPGIVPKDASQSRKRTIHGERSRTIPGAAMQRFPPTPTPTETRACFEREPVWRTKIMLSYRALSMYS